MGAGLGDISLWFIEGLSLGFVFVGEDMSILFRNKAALLIDGRLAQENLPVEWRQSSELREAIRSGATRALALPRESADPIEAQFIAAPLKLRANTGATGGLLLRDPLQSSSNPEFLQQHFSLTSAEVRLTQLLLTGATLKKAAAQLEVSTETVRSQLKSIFSKTNTRRQAELVLKLTSPLSFWSHTPT